MFAAFIEEVCGICHVIGGYALYGFYTVTSPILRFLGIDWLFKID